MSVAFNEEDVLEALSDVIDPEVNVAIIEMGEDNGLIDEINIEEKNVEVKYHATTPYCPPVFAMQISMDIKSRCKSLKDVGDVKVVVSGHMMSDTINQRVNDKSE